jgi:hypothetical protein
MQKTRIATCVLLLLLSTVFVTSSLSSVEIAPISEGGSVSVIEGDRVYVSDVNAYISAAPKTLTADGYVYLNVTSDAYGGAVDFLFGFDGNLAYPKSLEVYDPKNETTQHVLNLTSYLADPACRVDYNFTSVAGKAVYDGYVWVDRNNSIINENNETVSWKQSRVLFQHYDFGYPDAKVFYWNTAEALYWRSIRENWNFDKNAFSFKGMSTWYIANATVEKGKEYYLRLWLTLVPTLDDVTRKFYIALKPHTETLEQALANNRLYYLDPWYNDGWDYRKSHVINAASGAGTNYQVKIRVHRDSGTDYGENVYLNGKCKSDFGDIRFTTSDGSTLLDYWMESLTESEAVFWVEVADDLSSADRTIYVYYRNPSAYTTSNGGNTFLLFDNFDGGDIDWSKWDVLYWADPNYGYGQASYSVYGGKLVLTSPEGSYRQIQVYSKTAYGSSAMHVRVYPHPLAQYNIVSAWGRTQDKPTEWWQRRFGQLNGVGLTWFVDDYNHHHYARWGTSNEELNVYIAEGWTTYWEGFIKNTMIVEGYDSITENTLTTNIPNANLFPAFLCGCSAGYAYQQTYLEIDWVFLRKYVSPEPVHGAWGQEEGSGVSARASTVWYSSYLSWWFEQYWPGETSASTSVHATIYYDFDTYRDYDFLGDYYGGATSKSTILNVISEVNNNYDYSAVWHYGHGTTYTMYGIWVPWGGPPYYVPIEHHRYWDSYGENVFDNEIYPLTGSGTNKFVFMWTCGSAQWIGYYDWSWQNEYGTYYGTGAVGMPFAWTHTDGLSDDGYTSPDSTEYAFLGFYNWAKPLSVEAGNGKTYGDFIKKFYQYALQENEPINKALDDAATYVWGTTFGNTILHYGWNEYIPEHGWFWNQMRIYGNGNNHISQ